MGQIGLKRSRRQSPVNMDSWLRNGSLGGTSQGNPLFLTKGAAYPPNSRPRTLWKNPASWDLSLGEIRIPLTLAHTSYSHKHEAKIRNQKFRKKWRESRERERNTERQKQRHGGDRDIPKATQTANNRPRIHRQIFCQQTQFSLLFSLQF